MLHKVEVWMLFVIYLLHKSCCSQRIECHWGTEFLCGDKCLLLTSLCQCGNETISFADASNSNCCHQEPCFKGLDGNVQCQDGRKQDWRVACDGSCKQDAMFGYHTILCSDQLQCVKEASLCRGFPLCNE